MRAKTINEVQKFERGQDPKEAMDIGLKTPSYEQVRDLVFSDEIYEEFDRFINDVILDSIYRKYPKAKPSDVSMAINAASDEIMDTWEETSF